MLFFAFSPLVVKLWIDWMSYNKDEVILSLLEGLQGNIGIHGRTQDLRKEV